MNQCAYLIPIVIGGFLIYNSDVFKVYMWDLNRRLKEKEQNSSTKKNSLDFSDLIPVPMYRIWSNVSGNYMKTPVSMENVTVNSDSFDYKNKTTLDSLSKTTNK